MDLGIATPRKRTAVDDLLRFIYVGRLHETKGIDFLLGVLRDIERESGRPFHLTIVGGGPIEARLREEYRDTSWVSFTGRIPPSDVQAGEDEPGRCTLCSILVAGGSQRGVVRQALRAGVPAIVSDSGGSSEMIEEGTSGLVIPTGNAQRWKEALSDLIADRVRANTCRRALRHRR